MEILSSKRKSFKKFLAIIGWLFLGLIFLSPIIIFICVFCDSPISNNPEDWGNLGDYIGGIYSVLVAILVFVLTRSLKKRDDKFANRAKAAEGIFHQIQKVKNGKNQHSIDKLIRDVHDNEIYLPQNLISKLIKLIDQYGEEKDSGISVDIEIENDVLANLKDIYNG